jgi:hypothetical protein
MSKYDFMYSTYDLHPNIASPTTTNYFEKQIKEGLPYFQKNKLQSTLRNNYFSSKNDNGIAVASNEKIDTTELEAKKIIEREMNPYISYMKKE